MIWDLTGKNAFVSGGAQALGLAYAKALARNGVNIALADIDFDKLQVAVDEIGALGVKAVALPVDVTESTAMHLAARQADAELGKIHFVVNIPGVCCTKPLLELTELDWQWLIASNLMHLIHSTQAFLPLIRKHGEGGRIFNMISMSALGTSEGALGLAGYSVTKHAALAYTEELRAALLGTNIGVSALFPLRTQSELYAAWKTRQARFGSVDESSRPDYMGFDDWLKQGESPSSSADALIDAIHNDRFYVVSSGALRERVAAGQAQILAAMDEANDPASPNSSSLASGIQQSEGNMRI